jgi:Tfp pilus assembly PilM family ATPase
VPLYTKDLALGTATLLEALKRNFALGNDEAERLLHGQDAGGEVQVDLPAAVCEVFEDLASAVERAAAFLKSSGEAEKVSRIPSPAAGGSPGLRDFWRVAKGAGRGGEPAESA